MDKEYCVYCMNDMEGAEVCPHCGKTNTSYQSAVHQLRPGTILKEKYMVGAVLGEGGFGITYIGRDITLDMKIAIKEYFPNGAVTRNNTHSSEVTKTADPTEGFFEKGKGNFLTEARTLAKFAAEPNCVSVRDFFEANNTAYIVMEYLEGADLKTYLDSHGKLSFSEMYSLLSPVMRVLGGVHEQGLIHRDISPANIMVLDNGQAKLLDFGAARDISTDGEKSLSILLKPGYAPEEQYRTKGKQGAWTDVYALSATVYKLLTGVTPMDSMNRVFSDELESISKLNPTVTPEQEAAVMKGMSVRMEDRYQSMAEMIQAYEAVIVVKPVAVPAKTIEKAPPVPKPDKTDSEKKISKPMIFAGIGVAVCLVGVVAVGGIMGNRKEKIPNEESSIVTVDLNVESIDWSGRKVSFEEITSLQKMKKLKHLYLDDCGLTNEMLEEIGKLGVIRTLSISDNQDITDLSPLNGMKDLLTLRINGLTNADINTLPVLSNVVTFECNGCGLTELSLVEKLPHLGTLCANENEITDISALAKIDFNGMGIELNNNRITDISVLTQGEGPYRLYVANNQITDLSPLFDHSEIVKLNVSGNQIQDISPLRDCFKIENLDISNNQIENIEALSTIDALKKLDLHKNKISDLNPLLACTVLKAECTELDISENKLVSADGIRDFAKLSALNLAHNQITQIFDLASCPALNDLNLNDNLIEDSQLEVFIDSEKLKFLYLADNPLESAEYVIYYIPNRNALNLTLSYVDSIDWQAVYDANFNSIKICDVTSDRELDALKKMGFRNFATIQELYEAEGYQGTNDKNNTGSQNTDDKKADDSTVKGFTRATATSTLAPTVTESKTYYYDAENVLSDDLTTSWTTAGNGIDESITLYADSPQNIKELLIYNGVCEDSSVFEKNNRIKECVIKLSNGTEYTTTLDGAYTSQPVVFSFPEIVSTESVTLTIKSTYPGTEYDETAITYIQPVFGDQT